MYKNRILISLGLVAGLTFFGIKSFATSTGVVNTETARMRAEANTTSNIVALVSQDEKVEILEKSGDWYKVKYKDNTGYIYAQYVDNKDKKNDQTTNNTAAQNNTTVNNKTENNNTIENTQTSVEVSTTAETSTADEKIIENNTQILVVEDASLKLVPLINSTEIKSLKANTSVTVLDYANGWYFVNSEDAQGWVRKEKLDTLKQTQKESESKAEETVVEDTTTNTETEEKSETKTTKYVNVEKANLREKASKDSDTIKSISKNTAVTVVGTEGTWSKVEVDGKTGYILSELLSSDKVKETTNTDANTTKDKNTTSTKNNVTNRGEEIDRSQSANSGNVVSYASSFLGTRYILGGASPSGFDCSGFTMYVYGKYGVSLAHSARAQASVGTAVDRANLQAGDLVLFKGATGNSIGHVGIYIGGNNFIHASNPSDGVKITSMSTSYYQTRYVTSRRVF